MYVTWRRKWEGGEGLGIRAKASKWYWILRVSYRYLGRHSLMTSIRQIVISCEYDLKYYHTVNRNVEIPWGLTEYYWLGIPLFCSTFWTAWSKVAGSLVFNCYCASRKIHGMPDRSLLFWFEIISIALCSNVKRIYCLTLFSSIYLQSLLPFGALFGGPVGGWGRSTGWVGRAPYCSVSYLLNWDGYLSSMPRTVACCTLVASLQA